MPNSYLRKRFHLDKSIFPWHSNPYGAQDFVPVDPKLHSKLGVSKGAKIHVFAGYYGNWAHALAEGSKRVRYTDASKDFTDFARKQSVRNVSYKTIAAELAPIRKNAFDWSFSFEPFPLLGHKGIGSVVSRALLNRKGLKVLFSDRERERGRALIDSIKFVGEVYGAKMKTEKVELDTTKTSDKLNNTITFPRMHEFTVITLLTNPLAREKAAFDLKVQNIVDKAIKKTNPQSYGRASPLLSTKRDASIKRTHLKDFEFASSLGPVLAKQLKISPKTVKESLVRLKKLAELYERVN